MKRPNIIVILNDDMGFSDIGCYGGEIDTPNLDCLALKGLRYSQFYNTARCSPSRASLLTGLHPHQTGIGILTYSTGPEGYVGNLTENCVTIPEVLKSAEYRTYMSGKWHVSSNLKEPNGTWPTERGFDEFYGTVIGAGSFYLPNTLTRGCENIEQEAIDDPEFFYTDAISNQAAAYIKTHCEQHPEEPFFMYVAYTAPHWPLHAHEKDIEKYRGRFDEGWDLLREQRLARLVNAGLIDASWQLTDRDPSQPPFKEANEKAWLTRLMEVYAAQIDRMDQGIGEILTALEEAGQYEDTMIVFLSDNGGCAEDIPKDVEPRQLVEELMIAQYQTRDGRPVKIGNDPSIMPGGEDTYQSYGTAWANLSNTPFRLYKHWVHEGGISTPLIIHWPNGIQQAGIRHVPGQLPDLMATILEVSGASYPKSRRGHAIPPCEGISLVQSFQADCDRENPLFWEHEGNAAIRHGKWKLVRKYPDSWELYDMDADRTEMHNLAGQNENLVAEMAARYQAWADRCGVIPREKILEFLHESNEAAFWEEEGS
ncbi:Arylsulfatase (plasmid) [Labrenzia sp. THAF191b]|uniref:arylsulfatase n=1 Tax=unclassified Labrenzia TaxID=2648686 RepID=UPI0012682462|nr:MULTISPECIES: arylsulfatase [unclassified Labrenzia]QFT01647.1 Arylsulfatase [Labrenzia sp. THAF191b]QFT07852.1 Arylsulfatase [Labrenzia sp. THAF191a]QFT19282.1 Arylsulfatase [Labrenzia sp. THAF187b]